MTQERWLVLSLAMSITSILVAAVCVGVCWRLASRFTRVLNRRSPSESTLRRLEIDQAELSSSLASLAGTVKKISNRLAVAAHRGKGSNDAPPVGTSKADLLRHYGMAGKAGPDFAKAQLSLVTKE